MTPRKKNGVTKEDIIETGKGCLPFDGNINRVGLPLLSDALIYWIKTADVQKTDALNYLMDIHAHLPESLHRSALSRTILFTLSCLGSRNFIPDTPLSLTQFEMIQKDSKETFFRLETLYPFWLNKSFNREWLLTLDSLGRQPYRVTCHNFPPDGMAEFLSQGFNDKPTLFGLLRFIMVMAIKGSPTCVQPELLTLQQYREPPFRSAVIIIKLAQGNWEMKDIEEVAEETMRVLETESSLINDIVSTVKNNNISTPFIEGLFIKLQAMLPHDQWKPKSRIVDYLRDLTARQKSGLNDSERRTALSL